VGAKRSYINPKFDFDVSGKSFAQLKDSASWNFDLAKRKVKRVFNQRAADKEYAMKHPKKKKEPGLGLGRTASLLKKVDD
jgi:hypothetical protein